MSNTLNNDGRTERDYVGEVSIPADMLYGVNTVRGFQNLTVSPLNVAHFPEFSTAFAQCKWAAALANRDTGVITAEECDAITRACDDIVSGAFSDSLIVDLMEGSGGTSTNMNFNEVIANRAQQLMGSEPGNYELIHPNDHVNRSQSTNDVYPAAMKIATYAMLGPLIDEVRMLARLFDRKAYEFADILHLGRTCLQDAQPMRLGQLFGGYASLTHRLAEELVAVRDKLRTLPLGGTAIGTGFGAPAGYRAAVYPHLSRVTGVEYQPPADPFDAMQNMDVFSRVSAELRTCATSLAKVAADLTVLSSGPVGGVGELRLPEAQAGSSIMPGKVNPVLPMAMIQLSFAVVGNDVAVAQAVQYGELEINHFEPVVASRVFDSITLLKNGIQRFGEKCVVGIQADVARNEKHLLESMAVATALVPTIGYAKVSKLARQSVAEGRPLVSILEETGLLSKQETLEAIKKASHPVFNP
ncbi:aspartate ammonia-lyase [Cupriavidus metallidurans]|uniref:Aspartate ammonia-lyase n=2 Tax=Cupriavidus TaxID=106589 RepID=A0A3G8GX49_9BURK|nr:MULTISPECIES: aspartate ammonia-lyase [Cupriavidus]AZG11932.1 aspartate ammonia-lyase [Cupriavidus pauculus]KAB0600882.1 aspartate ammonia-lyase [Cupriavidus pauculus]MDE4922459.1 aspartate ammonia-lyase [Cupriavidus metallidurans]QBP14596.1 aspartate ammonia-lyase [Cupriavidus metallidurans]UAL02637.1 aspartate ammonia-lyase [Cupriavidus pauculus]